MPDIYDLLWFAFAMAICDEDEEDEFGLRPAVTIGDDGEGAGEHGGVEDQSARGSEPPRARR